MYRNKKRLAKYVLCPFFWLEHFSKLARFAKIKEKYHDKYRK